MQPDTDPFLVQSSSLADKRPDVSKAEPARQREHVESILENAFEGLHRIDSNGKILWANRSELQTLGYSREEYVGRNIAEFHLDADVMPGVLTRSMRGESVAIESARMRCKDGSLLHVQLRYSPYHEAGKLLYAHGCMRDVTEGVEGIAERQRDLELKRSIQKVLDGRALQQAAIARLGLEALASPDLSETLSLLVREAASTLGADFCSVVELRPDRTSYALRADFGWTPSASDPRSPTCALGDSQARYTLRTAAPVVSGDLRAETRFSVPPAVLERGVASSMSVVLHGKHQAWGVLGAHTKTQRAFSEDDINFLRSIANLMSLAVERDRVEIDLSHRNRQQAAVAALGKSALAGPHMEEFFAEALRVVTSTLEVDLCDLLQRDNGDPTLMLRAGVGWHPGLVGTARVSARMNSQVGFALNAQGPVMVTDLRAETRFDASPILYEHDVISAMSVLIPGRKRAFGVLGAYTRSIRTFTQDDGNFLQSVANLLAAAIERHGVEGELRRHRDDLEGLVEERTVLLAASNRELEAFSYTISHDLRAPLRSINGLSKIIQRKHGDSLPPEATEMLRSVADETVRMSRLIESILALSRLGTVSLVHAPVDVSATANLILQTLQARDPARKVDWTVEPGLRAVGDAGLLSLLLENLLGNAWKFTGQVEDARITMSSEVGGFRVEDNGAGFDMVHARELFQPFHRLHSAEQFEGTGIGLATVSRIVGRHSGRVWAESAPGKGATFHVTLPPQATTAPASVSLRQAPSHAPLASATTHHGPSQGPA